MFGIVDDIRQGNEMKVRLWLDNTENDPNLSDDHRFSLLHWASKSGNLSIVEMLIMRGARVNVTNMGDDTPLHLAAAHNHRSVMKLLIDTRAVVDAVNEHGNTPLHYTCFWNYQDASEDLLNAGASVTVENQFGDTPLDKARPRLTHLLQQHARRLGHDTEKRESFRHTWSHGTVRTRSRDPTLSREAAVDLKQLRLLKRLCINHGGEVWSGEFKETEVVVKVLRLRKFSTRHTRDFNEECPRLRIFNHVNILPLVASCASPTNLLILTPCMPFGSLHNVLHHGGVMTTRNELVVDTMRTLQFALDIAKGMEFLHCPELKVASFALNSKHVMVDEDLTAKLNMGDVKFSFHEKHREYSPAWVSPESLRSRPSSINKQAADMWSFGIILWELETREEPFSEMGPMETGLRIVTENLRVKFPPGMSKQKQTLIQICTNESPGKRPKFDQIIPILEKMKNN